MVTKTNNWFKCVIRAYRSKHLVDAHTGRPVLEYEVLDTEADYSNISDEIWTFISKMPDELDDAVCDTIKRVGMYRVEGDIEYFPDLDASMIGNFEISNVEIWRSKKSKDEQGPHEWIKCTEVSIPTNQ